jgi:hypothetical protein
VEKRKMVRVQVDAEAKRRQEEDRLEQEIINEMKRGSEDLSTEASCSGAQTAAVGQSGAARKYIGSLLVQTSTQGKKKQLSRKQLRRKEKIVEKGCAITDALEKKWQKKKSRVKVRAQTRNDL